MFETRIIKIVGKNEHQRNVNFQYNPLKQRAHGLLFNILMLQRDVSILVLSYTPLQVVENVKADVYSSHVFTFTFEFLIRNYVIC